MYVSRTAQAAALALKNVGMATAVDLLDPGAPNTEPCPQPAPDQRPTCLNPNGMCHSRWKAEVGERLAAVTARMIFTPTDLALAAGAAPHHFSMSFIIPSSPGSGSGAHFRSICETAASTLPPLSPTIGRFGAIPIDFY